MKKLIPYVLFTAAIALMAIVFYLDTLDMVKAAYQLPRILIVVVLLLSALMIVERVYLIRKARTAGTGAGGDASAAAPEPVNLSRVAVFTVLLAGYVLTIKPLGYFIVTPLYLAAVLLYLRATKLPWVMAIAFGFTVFVYLLFVLFLRLPVPMGLLR